MTKEDEIIHALSQVVDPEMGLSVTELGLIYGVEIQDTHTEVTMTPVSYTHLTLPTNTTV